MHTEETIFESNFYIKQGDCCLDIGANTGLKSRQMLDVISPQGRVHAFEPWGPSFKYLELIKDIRFSSYRIAISDIEGDSILYSSQFPYGTTFGASTIMTELAVERRLDDIAEIKIKTTTIDIFCEKHNITPNFIKIDAEGAESKIIKGGVDIIKEFTPIIYFEFGVGAEEKFEPDSHLQLIDLGYDLFNTEENRKFEVSELDGIIENGGSYYCNLLAIPKK